MKNIKTIIGDPVPFVKGLLEKVGQQVDISNLEIDHICYRVSSYKNYAIKKRELSQFGMMIAETEVNGRPIACFKLDSPVKINHNNRSWIIPLIELPTPKLGKNTVDGLEHLEIVLNRNPMHFMADYPQLEWITTGANKKLNPEIELSFGSLGSVKFHEASLEEIIKIEADLELFNFTYEDEDIFVIDKPQGCFTQEPENTGHRIDINKYLTPRLERHFGLPVFPVHRLDSATTGLVIYAKNSEMASTLGRMIRSREIRKKYWCVTRGYLDEQGSIDLDLLHPTTKLPKKSLSTYRCLKTIELPFQIGQHATSRYSLAEVEIHTGRWHQIRRHMDQISHPLIGDIVHGDSHHNRLFRDELGLPGLWLRAFHIEFTHPKTQRNLIIQAKPSLKWKKIFKLFEFDPSTI